MDFKFTDAQIAFRKEVADFLQDEISKGLWKPACDAWIQGQDPSFTKRVAAKGWIGLSWPKELGGQGRSAVDRMIMTEEMLRYGAPAACHWFADRQIGNAVIHYGTDAQKKEWLPIIMRGEAYVGLGLSEPDAASDLASIKTKATETEDGFIIDGQKVWTSCAKHMNYIYLVARTDPTQPKHRGISEFLFSTQLPGVTLTPTVDITGSEAWCETFLDQVKVPKSALIGTINKGFYQVVNQLDFERAGLERLMGNYPLYEALIKYCKETKRHGQPLCKDGSVRNKLTQLQVEYEVGRLLTYRVALVIDEGRAPNTEASMAKAYSTAFEQHLAMLAMDILGLYGSLVEESKYEVISGMAPASFLASKGYSLQAGTSEILRNVFAQRGLGLPA
ncbi:MAG: acyl-CoA dehydrogenase family protein [Dehalococcoidales bacterium]|nr:acyl-CoA dehydrogenase family protein [Dehalococcoidales bacterium]